MDFTNIFYRDLDPEQARDRISIGGSRPPAATVSQDRWADAGTFTWEAGTSTVEWRGETIAKAAAEARLRIPLVTVPLHTER
jgi:hypothetical protein